MGKRYFTAIASVVAMVFCALFSSSAHAVSGNVATISGGEWSICIATSGDYDGSSFVADITGAGFASQIVYDDFADESCRTVKLAAGDDYTVTIVKPMGVSEMDYTISGNKLIFSTGTIAKKYLATAGAFVRRIAASKIGISFDANGGEGIMPEMTILDVNTSFTLDSNTLTRAGYRFNGWNTKADGTGTSYADGETITLTKGGTVTLYAQWVQATATLKTGQNVNEALKTLAKGSSAFFSDTDNLIKNFSFVDTLPSTVNQNTPKANIALDGEIPVYAYWVANDEAIYINTEADKIYANQDSVYMFYKMQSLASLTLPDSFDTSKVTNMGGMFRDMQSLTSLTLPDSFDTSRVTNMRDMFYNMQSLTSLTLPDSFDTSNVTDMNFMFGSVESLTSLTLPDSFDTSNVTDMGGMFFNMRSLTSLTLPDNFSTSSVTDMSYMFRDMQSLTSLTLPDNFSTSSVTDMSYMFSGMESLTSLTLPDSFNTSKVTNMGCMFSGMESLTSLTLPDSFVIASGTTTTDIFANIRNTATIYATDATARSLWPGVLGN